MELSGIQLVKIPEHGLLQKIRVQRGDAIDGMAADTSQMRHADRLLAGLVDEGKPR